MFEFPLIVPVLMYSYVNTNCALNSYNIDIAVGDISAHLFYFSFVVTFVISCEDQIESTAPKNLKRIVLCFCALWKESCLK